MPSLVVEFTGARGAGKSTLAELVRLELQKQQVPYNRFAPLGHYRRWTLRLSGFVAQLRLWILWLAWRPTSLAEIRFIQNRFRKYRFRMRRSARANGVVLLEEGVFQLMMILHAKTAQKDMNLIAEQLGRLVPFPDVVVFVGATEEAIAARRRIRGNRRDVLKPRVSSAGRSALAEVQEFLGGVPHRNGPQQVIYVANDDMEALKAAAAEAATAIRRRFRSVS